MKILIVGRTDPQKNILRNDAGGFFGHLLAFSGWDAARRIIAFLPIE